jgi:hypothetical protein
MESRERDAQSRVDGRLSSDTPGCSPSWSHGELRQGDPRGSVREQYAPAVVGGTEGLAAGPVLGAHASLFR